MTTWDDIRRGIFAGESGGDYGALYGFANRPGKMFSDVDVRNMTINEVLDFQNPSGPYAQYVGGLNRGVVSSPAGAYQIVGRTLRDARDRMGLTGGERFDEAMQDRIGRWIYDTQGTGAWEGYQGPRSEGMATAVTPQQAGLLAIEPTQRDRRRDLAGRAAMAFNTLRQRPDASIPAIVEARRGDRQSNRTADWLRSQPGGEVYAQMADMGRGAEGLAAYQAATTAAANPNVQSSKTLPDLSGTVMTMRDGSVRVVTAGGETLTGQEALDFVRASQEANVGYQQDIYGARRFGTLSADLTLGGEAAQETEEGKQRVKWAGDALADARVVQSSIININDAIRAIDEGAEAGMVYNMLPNITVASASLKNAMDKMGLDVIGSVTFGALSEAELKLAMETAVPRNLGREELRAWLSDKLVAQQKAQAALIETAAHFAGGGSQADYIAKYKSVTSEAQTADRQATHRFNPETGQVEEVK